LSPDEPLHPPATGFPGVREREGPDHGAFESNANVLTSQSPPYDPAMGTYQLRGLLCRIERA